MVQEVENQRWGGGEEEEEEGGVERRKREGLRGGRGGGRRGWEEEEGGVERRKEERVSHGNKWVSVREKKKGKEGDGRRAVRCELSDYKCQPFLSSCLVSQVLLVPRRRRLLQLRQPPATSLLRRERAREGCRLVWDVCTQCENFSKFYPCDQLSRNQLLLNQLPMGQLPLNQLPTKSTVNLCMNTCTNEQVHYCSITKVQFGVALNTLQD